MDPASFPHGPHGDPVPVQIHTPKPSKTIQRRSKNRIADPSFRTNTVRAGQLWVFSFFLKKEMSLNPRLRVLGIKWSTGYGDTETQPFCDVSPDGLNSYTAVSTVSRIHA